jgi:hypothetical protein
MFSLFRKPQPRHPTAAMARALVSDGLPPGIEASTLSVVQQHGSYSGRRVSYFRAFDPIRVAQRGLQIRGFTDLDAHPDLVLGSGHVEADGAVVLSRRRESQVTSTPVRSEADRSAHADDEQVVFPTRTA